jgi:hypothetical protein
MTGIEDNKLAQGAAFATGVAGWFAVGYVASKAKNPAVTLGIMGGAFAASVAGATLSENKMVKKVSQGSLFGCVLEIMISAAKYLYKLVQEFRQNLAFKNQPLIAHKTMSEAVDVKVPMKLPIDINSLNSLNPSVLETLLEAGLPTDPIPGHFRLYTNKEQSIKMYKQLKDAGMNLSEKFLELKKAGLDIPFDTFSITSLGGLWTEPGPLGTPKLVRL